MTRPSMISGEPVWSDTSVTVKPASRKAFAVPPVLKSFTFSLDRAVASSTNPVLSDTESKAVFTATKSAEDPATEVIIWGADIRLMSDASGANRGRKEE